MKKLPTILTGLLVFCMLPNAHAILIDDFSTGGTEVFANVLTPGSRSITLAPGAIGGQRESTVFYNAPGSSSPGNIGARINFLDDGTLHHNQDAGVAGRSVFVYDGSTDVNTVDGLFEVDATGLGGLDLTEGGLSDRFLISVLFADHAVDNVLSIRAYSDETHYSELFKTIASPISSATLFSFLYGDFVLGAGAAGIADFTNIGAIVFAIDGNSQMALDIQLDQIETSVIPEPATLALLGIGLAGAGLIRRRRK